MRSAESKIGKSDNIDRYQCCAGHAGGIWSRMTPYIFPPFCLVGRTLLKIHRELLAFQETENVSIMHAPGYGLQLQYIGSWWSVLEANKSIENGPNWWFRVLKIAGHSCQSLLSWIPNLQLYSLRQEGIPLAEWFAELGTNSISELQVGTEGSELNYPSYSYMQSLSGCLIWLECSLLSDPSERTGLLRRLPTVLRCWCDIGSRSPPNDLQFSHYSQGWSMQPLLLLNVMCEVYYCSH